MTVIKYNQPATEPQFWNQTPILEKCQSLRKKSSLTPKKVKMGAPKKMYSPNPSGHGLFAKKNRSKMFKFGLCGPISDLETPIGGHHSMLYFTSQITKKYSIVLYYIFA